MFAQKWSKTVFNNATCHNYRVMTLAKQTQIYILKLPKLYVYALCKFKCANHCLPIVTGRYTKIPIRDRLCTLCRMRDIGDEFHYLFKCMLFRAQRAKYIRRYYYTQKTCKKCNNYLRVQIIKKCWTWQSLLIHLWDNLNPINMQTFTI